MGTKGTIGKMMMKPGMENASQDETHGLWLGHGEDDGARTYGWVLGGAMAMVMMMMSRTYGWVPE